MKSWVLATEPRVLATKPVLKEVIWGSHRLQTEWGKALPRERLLGETWEISAIPGMECGLAGEKLNLREAFEAEPGFFLAAPTPAPVFPLLVKLLSTADLLSVQIHPNDEQARRLDGGGRGKHEAWLILDAEPGAHIHMGLAPGREAEDLRRAIEGGTSAGVAEVLRSVEVAPGQVFDIPPGTVHAIGAGVTLLEVQQPSDATYRLFDWERRDADGNSRELHVKKALEVLDVAIRPDPAPALGPTAGISGTRHLDNESFRLDRWSLDGETSVPVPELLLLVCLGGRGKASVGASEPVILEKGRSCVVPVAATMLDLVGSSLELAAIRPPPIRPL